MTPQRSRLGALTLVLGGVVANLSCAQLNSILGSGVISPPKVTFLGADLVRAPSQLDFSAFYCPKVITSQAAPLGMAADFVCSRFFGKAPAATDMQVGFDLKFEVANPNQIPLPLAEILTAIAIFPGETQQNLGAVCLNVCDPGDASCLGGSSSTGCQEAPGDLKGLDDFPRAGVQVLVAQGLGALGVGQPSGFKLPKVTAASKLAVTARLALTPEALVPAMEQLARKSLGELRAGRKVAFEIPFRLEGTVFANAGSLGRVAAGYGPASGVWPVPTERLLPTSF